MLCASSFKETVHPKNENSFTHPQVVTNLCLFCPTQRKIFWRRLFLGTIDFHSSKKTILLCFPHSSIYLPFCSEQTHSYRFGSTWGWVNDDRVFIFGCTVSLNEESTEHLKFVRLSKWWLNFYFCVYCPFKWGSTEHLRLVRLSKWWLIFIFGCTVPLNEEAQSISGL